MDGFRGAAPQVDRDSAAAAAVDALAVCKLVEWAADSCSEPVPAISATVCAVISVGFTQVAEIQQALLLAVPVVCSALATRCRVAFAVSNSVAVEFIELIDPGCDPPLLSCY